MDRAVLGNAKSYTHTPLLASCSVATDLRRVIVAPSEGPPREDALFCGLFSMRLASLMGIRPPHWTSTQCIPYGSNSDNLTFDACLSSLIAGQRVRHLRGWKQFRSCIKGFNALGLMAEQVIPELKSLQELNDLDRRNAVIEFLRSRKSHRDAQAVFENSELDTLSTKEIKAVDLLMVALWRVFSRRTIVCSTSTNMGVTLHDALSLLSMKTFCFRGKHWSILNADEGKLVIWCPDERADFMNADKANTLCRIEKERNGQTVLRKYINRTDRDSHALREAIQCGGYFFPTNPQSPEEMQSLISTAIHLLAEESGLSFSQWLKEERFVQTLRSVGSEIMGDRVFVRRGIAGGLYGLAIPYLAMLEETLQRGDSSATSSYNPASIGGALAAAVWADMLLRSPEKISAQARKELQTYFPVLADHVLEGRFGELYTTRIHGTFDTANLQSIAQLFGAVGKRHLSGRGTAFVGLGSSSYANGNLVYDILRESVSINGPFRGKTSLHPATHTLNPVAQALIYADSLIDALQFAKRTMSHVEPDVGWVMNHVKKPEPAGAAALAGYLLARLDDGTLSVVEVAFALRVTGFSAPMFLEFATYGSDAQGRNQFLQDAAEEGEYMGQFAIDLVTFLDWDLQQLSEFARSERRISRMKYSWKSLDDDLIDERHPVLQMYVTGDDCAQPQSLWVEKMVFACLANWQSILSIVSEQLGGPINGFSAFTFSKRIFAFSERLLTVLQRVHERGGQAMMDSLVQRMENEHR